MYYFNLFSDKVLITTGIPYDNGCKTEIVDLNDYNLKHTFSYYGSDSKSHPLQREGAIGNVLQGQPLICGGYKFASTQYQDRLPIGKIKRVPKYSMMRIRLHSASVVLENSRLLVVGGEKERSSSFHSFSGSDSRLKCSEMFCIGEY